jgi:hypothetical protein
VNLPKTIRITERKLGKERAMGQVTHGKVPHIEIDPRQKSADRLDTVIHECVHIIWPELPEEAVIKVGNRISSVLWADGWRRIME